MSFDSGISFDLIPFWTWFLILVRCFGLLETLPGVGTMQIPPMFRFTFTFAISLCLVFGGVRANLPATFGEAGLMVVTEFLLGIALGLIPALIISGIGVAGQVTTGAIGLGQANMMDPSLGGQVAILARLQMLIAVSLFLLIDGHHAAFKAAAGLMGDIGLGYFRPTMDIFMVLLDRFTSSFELAVMCSAPILVTILVTNFVLGLITKFVPQVNIFIISLPLTIIVGLYIVVYTFPGVNDHLIRGFNEAEFALLRLVTFK